MIIMEFDIIILQNNLNLNKFTNTTINGFLLECKITTYFIAELSLRRQSKRLITALTYNINYDINIWFIKTLCTYSKVNIIGRWV